MPDTCLGLLGMLALLFINTNALSLWTAMDYSDNASMPRVDIMPYYQASISDVSDDIVM